MGAGPSSGGEAWNLPLRTAIATSNPSDPGSRYYTEPLDPANLDRFVLQLQTEGAISGARWDEAARIIDMYAEIEDDESAAAEAAREEEETQAASAELVAATEAHKHTRVPISVRKTVLELL